MKLEIDKFLDGIDEWKFKVYEDIKNMTTEEKIAYFRRAGEEALARGLKYLEVEEDVPKLRKQPASRTSGNGSKKGGRKQRLNRQGAKSAKSAKN